MIGVSSEIELFPLLDLKGFDNLSWQEQFDNFHVYIYQYPMRQQIQQFNHRLNTPIL